MLTHKLTIQKTAWGKRYWHDQTRERPSNTSTSTTSTSTTPTTTTTTTTNTTTPSITTTTPSTIIIPCVFPLVLPGAWRRLRGAGGGPAQHPAGAAWGLSRGGRAGSAAVPLHGPVSRARRPPATRPPGAGHQVSTARGRWLNRPDAVWGEEDVLGEEDALINVSLWWTVFSFIKVGLND